MVNRILYLLLLVPQLCAAQYLFTNLKPEDGLSSRENYCVFVDKEGYVWIGAKNGLNRFDGSHFKLWNHSSPVFPAQLGESVYTVTEYRKQIWFGTNKGAGLFDKTNNTFSEVDVKTSASEKPVIQKLQADKNNRLWMATNRGIFISTGKEFIPVGDLYPFAKELHDVYCYHAAFSFDSASNCFWIGSDRGLYCLDLENKRLLSEKNNPGRLPIFTNTSIRSLALDRTGNISYSDHTREQLYFYNFSTKAFDSISSVKTNPPQHLDFGCNTLFYDTQNRLWMSTWLFSAFIHHPDGTTEQIPYDRSALYSIAYGFFNDAFQDAYGNIWLATINGISKLPSSNFVKDIIKVPTYPYFFNIEFANINSFQIDKQGNYYLGKMDGVVKYEKATKTYKHFTPFAPKLHGRWNDIIAMEWVNDELWCATYNGIHIFNPITETFHEFTAYISSSVKTREIIWIHLDRKGRVWFSVHSDAVYRFDTHSGAIERFSTYLPAITGSVHASFSCLETSRGQIWISVSHQGVRLFDEKEQRFLPPAKVAPAGSTITSIVEDRRGFMWCNVSGKGLFKFDENGNAVDSITKKNGFTEEFNEYIGYLTCDHSGRLWGVSREALLSIDPEAKEVTRNNIKVTYSFNNHWIYLFPKDSLLYATMLDHLVIINTAKYGHIPQALPPLISGFKVFQEETPFSKDNDIKLNYSQNFFSFDFSSPFHHESLGLQYAYKLEGFDKNWVYCGRARNASYTNVPDGHYVFKVRCTDGNGQWMESVSAIQIIVKPPFWKTIEFIFLIILIAAGIVSRSYWLMKKRRREKDIDKAIDYFANSLYGENSVSEICWDIARNCIAQLRLEDCVVYLVDEKRNVLVQRAAYGPKSPKDHEIVNPIEIEVGKGLVGTAAKTCKPVLVNDTSKDDRYIVDDSSRLSELAVPIVHEGKAIGVIDSEHPRKNFFTNDHLKALTTIAAISSNKIAEAEADAQARESELQLLEIKKLLAESQLMALRAQMNPHFVFNCLNSIQECIVTQKYGEASMYLNKFSKLFRSVLNNSGKVMVTLAEEVEVLELYLSLEHMRFEQSFQYEVIVDEDLEMDEILIPSMLLQPYVENALWHGLMHKEGERELFISFQKKTEEVFTCIVDDNGIGRKKALELKEQQNKTRRHVSKGMTISKDRIELLQRQGQLATLDIVDKYSASGSAMGTRVVVELSSFLK